MQPTLALVPLLFAPTVAQDVDLAPRWRPTKSLEDALATHRDGRGVVLKLVDDAGTAATDGVLLVDSLEAELALVAAVLEVFPSVRVEPLFGLAAPELDALRAAGERAGRRELADLTQFFLLEVGTPAEVPELVAALLPLDAVENAYPAPVAVPPPGDVAPATPDFTAMQAYRAAAPAGVDAVEASLRGATGAGVTIADVEYSWNPNHEDLTNVSAASHVGPAAFDPFADTNHGTAVLGLLVGDDDTFGVRGLAPGATVITVAAQTSPAGPNVAAALLVATQNLAAGDVLLIEQQSIGPNWPGGTSQWGLVPVEYFDAEFHAIRQATALGIHVVEAAGNGAQDLDSPGPACPGTCAGHPTYPARFNLGQRNSGAIVVGATTDVAPYAPLWYSNLGSRVDAFAHGQNLMTTGYGPNCPGAACTCGDPFPAGAFDPNQWYTACFSGTSGASAVVAATVAVLEAQHVTWHARPWRPFAMRLFARQSGTGSANGAADRVGRMPDLRQGLDGAFQGPHLAMALENRAPTGDDRYGTDVDVLGDVDGDGTDDFAVGAPGVDGTNPDEGRVYLYSGETGDRLITLFGTVTQPEEFGTAVDGGLKLDGDTTPDLVIGAPGPSGTPGAVFLRSATGTVIGPGTITGENPGDAFGRSVAHVGDLDGDGLDDFVVGAPLHSSVAPNAGRAYVFLGGSGVASAANALFTVDGGSFDDFFGGAVAGVGDVNADGTPDFAVGAIQAPIFGTPPGYVRVYSGADASVLFTWTGEAAGNHFGTSVGAAGDVDADGYDDVLVGAALFPGGGLFQGKVYVRSGFDGSVITSAVGPTGDQLGKSVESAGDFDGDGTLDVLAGAPGSGGFSGPGKAYVLSGADGSVLETYRGWSPFPGAGFGTSVAALGDVDLNGRPEVLVGAPFADSPSAPDDRGAAYVFHASTPNAVAGPPSLIALPPTLSATTGGSSTLSIRAGAANAGKAYLLVTSGAGSLPGTTLASGLFVPLVVDALTIQGLVNANVPPFGQFLGLLDGSGDASGTFGPFPPPQLIGIVGFRATFAALTLDQTFATNAVEITVVP